MPSLLSVSRNLSSSSLPEPIFSRLSKFLLFSISSSPAAEKFLSHLQKSEPNIEKSLDKVKGKLDAPCITQVLKMCATEKPELGLRFFIWAGLQSHHRHSSYMYSNACELLGIERNSQLLADVFDAYRNEDCVVSVKMFKVVLNLCRAAKDDRMGLWVLRKMKEFNCRPDTVSFNVVIRLLVEKGELNEAMGLMREMGLIDLYPDMVSYIMIIKGFCDAGRLEDAFELVKVMKGYGCFPNVVVYSTLLDGICFHGNLETALEFLGGMEDEKRESKPTVITYTTLIDAFVKRGRAMEAVKILDRMEDFGVVPNGVTIGSLVDGLCKEGHVEEALKLADKVSVYNLGNDKLYSLLVLSLWRAGKHTESENMLRMMISRGMKPSGLCLSSVIKGMSSDGRIIGGFGLVEALERSGNLPPMDQDIFVNLLTGLCRENHFAEAAKLANLMVERRILLKSSHAEYLIELVKSSGKDDLASCLASIHHRL